MAIDDRRMDKFLNMYWHVECRISLEDVKEWKRASFWPYDLASFKNDLRAAIENNLFDAHSYESLTGLSADSVADIRTDLVELWGVCFPEFSSSN